MFRTIFPSIIRSLRLYIQHQKYVIQVLWLLASKYTIYVDCLLAVSQQIVRHIPIAVNTVSRLLIMDSTSVRNM